MADKLDLVLASLRRIEALLRLQLEAADVEIGMRCVECQSTDLLDASVMGDERYICGECGAGMTREAVHG